MTNPTPSASGPKSERRKVLEEAADLIDGDRNDTYGTPTQNFTNIAEFWTTQLRYKLKDGEEFTAADVADFMILLKVARGIASRKRDTYVDIAGYAACGYETTIEPETGTTWGIAPEEPTEPKPHFSGGYRYGLSIDPVLGDGNSAQNLADRVADDLRRYKSKYGYGGE